eukprot:EG_transcript_3850
MFGIGSDGGGAAIHRAAPAPPNEAEGTLTGLFGTNWYLRSAEAVLQEWYAFYGAVQLPFRHAPPRDRDLVDVVEVVARYLRWLWKNKRLLVWRRFQRFKTALLRLSVCCRRWHLERQRAIADVVAFWRETERQRRRRCLDAAAHNRTAPLMRSAQECAVAVVSDQTKRSVTAELYTQRWAAWKQRYRQWREDQRMRQALAEAEAACQVKKTSSLWGVLKAVREDMPTLREHNDPSCPRFEFGRHCVTLYDLLKGAGFREAELELFDPSELGVTRRTVSDPSDLGPAVGPGGHGSPARAPSMRGPLPGLGRRRSVEAAAKPGRRPSLSRPHTTEHRPSPHPSPPAIRTGRRDSGRMLDDLRQWADLPLEERPSSGARPRRPSGPMCGGAAGPAEGGPDDPLGAHPLPQLRPGSSWRQTLRPLSRGESIRLSPGRFASPIVPVVTPSSGSHSPNPLCGRLGAPSPPTRSRVLAAQYISPARDLSGGGLAHDPHPDTAAAPLMPLGSLGDFRPAPLTRTKLGGPGPALPARGSLRRDPAGRGRASPEALPAPPAHSGGNGAPRLHGVRLVAGAGILP